MYNTSVCSRHGNDILTILEEEEKIIEQSLLNVNISIPFRTQNLRKLKIKKKHGENEL